MTPPMHLGLSESARHRLLSYLMMPHNGTHQVDTIDPTDRTPITVTFSSWYLHHLATGGRFYENREGFLLVLLLQRFETQGAVSK